MSAVAAAPVATSQQTETLIAASAKATRLKALAPVVIGAVIPVVVLLIVMVILLQNFM